MPKDGPKITCLLDAWKITHPKEGIEEGYIPERPRFSDLVNQEEKM